MQKTRFGALIYRQNILSEKKLHSDPVVIGQSKECDFVVDHPCVGERFELLKNGNLRLHDAMKASLCIDGKTYTIGEKRDGAKEDHIESYRFGENDWCILNLAPGLDLLIAYRKEEGSLVGAPLQSLSDALESPVARALVLSFAIHSAILFFAGLSSNSVETYQRVQQEARWIEMVSNVEEKAEEEQPEEDEPVIEDTDNVIIDDAVKNMDRPKIDDTPSPIANLDKVQKPVGLQAALGGSKLHDMESLFGSTAGLGNALDFMPETAEGDAFGTGAGFGAGLSGVGFGGGGGGGGGYGSGIGGMGGGRAAKSDKISGPKKSTVKHKPKLAMEAPKQGAFCKASNISDVVQKRANALRNCYEQQLLPHPDLSGKIILFWKIGLDGKVTDASVKSSTMNNPKVESCLTQTVRRLRFDKPDGGICVVEYPFIFTSSK